MNVVTSMIAHSHLANYPV